jgi:Leucine-rich repeat (LRR) protein
LKKVEPNAFRGLRKLTYLSLTENELEELPADLFRDLVNLSELHLKNNKLKRINTSSLVNIYRLDLSHNQLDYLNCDEHLSRESNNLRYLLLNDNKIQRIEADFFHSNLNSLTFLDISNNQLTTDSFNLNESSKNLFSLEYFSLANNSIKKIKQSTINHLISLFYLHFDGEIIDDAIKKKEQYGDDKDDGDDDFLQKLFMVKDLDLNQTSKEVVKTESETNHFNIEHLYITEKGLSRLE